jgi:hypothetical protein
MSANRVPIPLSERKWDIPLLAFLWLNILFITYQVDTEQLVIKDPSDFEYPIWPLRPVIDLIHWWGANFDPLLMARPPFWQMTIWIDQLFFGPFYIFAIYAFTKGRDWIRNWVFLYAASIMTNVTIILGEEVMGEHASDSVALVFLANGPWFLVPLLMIIRVWGPHPFTRAADATSD